MDKGILGPLVVFGAGVTIILVVLRMMQITISGEIIKSPYEFLPEPLFIIFASCLIIGFPLLLYGLTCLKALKNNPKVKSSVRK